MSLSFTELDKNDFQRVASKLDISPKLVESIYNKYFEILKNILSLKTMPTVRTKILFFQPSNYKFRKKYFNLNNFGTRENLTALLKSFWHIFERTKLEKAGKATYLEWIKLERAEKRYKDLSLYELIIKKLIK